MENLTFVEVSKDALSNNIKQFRKIVGDKVKICPCVKSNAYGHGLVQAAKIFLEAGADLLSVNALYEAKVLRENKISAPIYVMGYIPLADLKEAVEMDVSMVVYNYETIDLLSAIASKINKTPRVHIKVETGNNRQGVPLNDIVNFAQYIKKQGNIFIEGLSTHFANIEDTTDHTFAFLQLSNFKKAIEDLRLANIEIPIKHCANSAATILFKETHFDMVRVGISSYGMWSSPETFVSYSKDAAKDFALTPALTWKAKVVQVKDVDEGQCIGYGCTYKTTCKSKIAIIPVGYYDGYDRGINNAYVLIHGKRAPVRGRICMNMFMVDITYIDDVKIEDEVILIGRDKEETISAETFGKWAGTINYEATTRINERIPRIVVA